MRALDKAACFLVAQSAHDGFARALHPAHTRYDGDRGVRGGDGRRAGAEPNLDRFRAVAADVVADAIRAARSANIRASASPRSS